MGNKYMKKAFTLIELLVVIVIIGIIASLTFVALNSVRAKARDTKRIADIRNLQSALEIYKNDNGVYPTYATSGTALVANGQTYMAKIPTAPTNTGYDVYTYTSTDGTTYSIAYNLEKGVQDTGSGNLIALPGQVATVAPAPIVYALRDTGPGGGLIFYDKGSYSGSPSWRYLEAAPNTPNAGEWSSKAWGCSGALISGSDGTAIGDGKQNTADIKAGCATAGTPAKLTDSLVLNGLSGWFLPSKDELALMRTNLYLLSVGDFTTGYYWSSSEYSNNNAYNLNFSSGTSFFTNKDTTYYVRAVRAF